jgi:hypothetical protein
MFWFGSPSDSSETFWGKRTFSVSALKWLKLLFQWQNQCDWSNKSDPWKGQLAFLTQAKIRHFGILSALVKDSRQFKQRSVHLPLYKITTILIRCISWCGNRLSNMGEAVPQNGGKISREKG